MHIFTYSRVQRVEREITLMGVRIRACVTATCEERDTELGAAREVLYRSAVAIETLDKHALLGLQPRGVLVLLLNEFSLGATPLHFDIHH